METTQITPDESISLFVKNIVVFDERVEGDQIKMPFFADGYPGIMFQQTAEGMLVMPHKKQMPAFFIYGQTIQPIELIVSAPFHLVVFQLYPFVLNSFFGLTPKDLNDDCYDLLQVKNKNTAPIIDQLSKTSIASERTAIITNFLDEMFEQKKDQLDFKIRQAIQIIIDNKGMVTIADVCNQLKINERSFERRFLAQAGISAKQLARIVQFDASLNQLHQKDYNKLTDVVYANGFADQSHFIRVFKAFTGTTPTKFGNLL